MVHLGSHALCLDMRSFFFSFAMALAVFLKIPRHGRVFCLTRMMQGWSDTPAFAQHVMAILLWGLPVAMGAIVLWLDNVLAFGSPHVLQQFLDIFRA